jgi:LmbE family N-acetylglucosaminyl deacetylase
VIAPHPDDEAIGCAGVILRHRHAGDTVLVIYITDGSASRAGGLAAAEMRQARRGEADAACALLGVDGQVWLGAPENRWAISEFQAPLRQTLLAFQPHLIYAPSYIDFHPEHWKSAQLLSQCLDEHAPPLMRIYQIQVPLTAILVNCVADIAVFAQQIEHVFATYQTQQGSLASIRRGRHYNAAYYGQGQPVEVFWEMSATHYQRIHSKPLDRTHGRQFRGLRRFSFTDPLAYCQGRDQRQHFLHTNAPSVTLGTGT